MRKQGAANWVKKVQAPPAQGAGEERSLLAGPQIASGAEMKCSREAQVRPGVSVGPADGLFINCGAVYALRSAQEEDDEEEEKEAN